ncbi:MAG: Fe-S cluster assembly protein SufB [Candidatus Aenigmarchaeota archaeon]|nr:Fe-S cluster assembly protein SufB [Candidatus Aenigmarchaeota archaeon]
MQPKTDYLPNQFEAKDYFLNPEKGLHKEVVEKISEIKGEPEWMRDFRLRAFDIFISKTLPQWGPNLSEIDFNSLCYFVKPTEQKAKKWEDLPENILKTFEQLGIPEAEKKFLAGIGAQYESEMVYHNLKKELAKQGVIFLDMDSAIKEYPELVKKYFGTIIPPTDNKFAALNSAVWSGGSFIYVPRGVKVKMPLQAYFRINTANMGQFERTLIIADEGSFVHYIEGCTAPIYDSHSLHAGVVEIMALPGARVRYTTIQNWSKNVYNLVTKRAFAYKDAIVEWVDCNLGSKVTMKYPSVFLLGENAKAEILSIAFASEGQIQDVGGKIMHFASNTSSTITSKSISKDGGKTIYRGLVKVGKVRNVKSHVRCDALILDEYSASETIPCIEVNDKATIIHEASISKINEQQLFYLMSRGLKESEANALIIRGFIEPVAKQLPLEFAVELNRLIELQMEGSVG